MAAAKIFTEAPQHPGNANTASMLFGGEDDDTVQLTVEDGYNNQFFN